MRTFTLIIVIFIVVVLFFEVTDWTPSVPTTKEVTTEKTIIVETVDETGEIVDQTITKEESTETQRINSQ
jgi:hypothetical protein